MRGLASIKVEWSFLDTRLKNLADIFKSNFRGKLTIPIKVILSRHIAMFLQIVVKI